MMIRDKIASIVDFDVCEETALKYDVVCEGDCIPCQVELIIRAINTEIDKVENPYSTDCHLDAGVYDSMYRKGFERCREAVKKVLE